MVVYKEDILDYEIARRVATVFKALAHPVRLRIVDALENEEMCVNEIMDLIGGKQSLTSQQLNMMTDKGLLSRRREGARVFYKVTNPNVVSLLQCVHSNCRKNKEN